MHIAKLQLYFKLQKLFGNVDGDRIASAFMYSSYYDNEYVNFRVLFEI